MEWHPEQDLPVEFHQLAGQVYAQDPKWLPESGAQLKAAFSTEHAYFEPSQKRKVWLSVQPGQSRLAGFYDPNQRIDDQSVAFFGFWETQNELAPNQTLFRELEQWAKQQGADVLYGPINFTTFNAYRIRLSDFDQGCFPGEPYNPSYYVELMAQLGFSVNCRYKTDFLIPSEVMQGARLVKHKFSRHFTFTELTGEFWLAHLAEFYAAIDVIFSENFAYSPISYDVFSSSYGASIAQRLCPKTSVLALDQKQRIAGFFLVFPDYAPLCCQGASAPMALSEMSYAQHYAQLPEPRLALGKTMGVLPRYRNKGLRGGLYTILSAEVAERVAQHYAQTAACLMREGNPSQALVDRYRHHVRFYGLYEKALV